MTRQQTALKLLEHGPLGLAEFAEITGWPYQSAYKVLESLLDTGEVTKPKRGIYEKATK